MGFKVDKWKLKMGQYYKGKTKENFITQLIKSGFKIIHKEKSNESNK